MRPVRGYTGGILVTFARLRICPKRLAGQVFPCGRGSCWNFLDAFSARLIDDKATTRMGWARSSRPSTASSRPRPNGSAREYPESVRCAATGSAEGEAASCLAAQLPSPGHALGAPHRNLLDFVQFGASNTTQVPRGMLLDSRSATFTLSSY